MKVHYYYPYPANDGKHKNYIITKSERKYILALLDIQILPNIKTKKEKIGIFHAMRKMKSGVNRVLILPDFGVGGYYGINQRLKKVMKTLKKDF